MRAREPTSFLTGKRGSRVILLRVLSRMSWWRKQVIKCWEFYHLELAIGKGFTSFSGIKVARYSLSGSIPPKFERKLRRHKQRFGKIDTTVVLGKEENWL